MANSKSSKRAGILFPVVAVGASAGGVTAFIALLKELPANTGMVFVLIQHLERNHENGLPALLQNSTAMRVAEVTDGMGVEANEVYLLPPDKSLAIRCGKLWLTPRSNDAGRHRPLDDFCMALAEEQGKRAIGVVLSGGGSDGSLGLKAIRAAGGVTFAQDPTTAQCGEMAMSAIATGAADFVLPPARIAAELARIGNHPYLNGGEARGDLRSICETLHAAVGIDFGLYKAATLRRRIARRMALQRITSLSEYSEVLKQNAQESKSLADDVFMHVTCFFRDPESFEALRKWVLARLRPASVEEPIRIWVSGCSTGEDVYSIAILLLEELSEKASQTRIQIFGSDIRDAAVEFARNAVYSEAALDRLSPVRWKRFFTRTDSGYRIRKPIRDLCVFARHDLAKDPPFSRLDLIGCRNVLMDMGPALRRRALAIFHYALKPGGFLFLGESESAGDYPDGFAAEDQTHTIFVRKAAEAGLRDIEAATRHKSGTAVTTDVPSAVAFRKEAEAALLEHYAPPALVVDSALSIVHFQGDTSAYLAPGTGHPSFRLLKMARPELVVDLRAAIMRARKEGSAVHKDVRFEYLGKLATVRLEVRPLEERSRGEADLLVVFQPVEVDDGGALVKTGLVQAPERDAGRAGKLEVELASTREQLRALIGEYESAREEMQATNEETLSGHEELRTSNEELQTAKEELKSSNEELAALNDELRHRNAELGVLSRDLDNLLAGVEIAVLVLDAELCVRRFTPVAGRLLNLIQGDIGRPFSDMAPTFGGGNWNQLLGEVKRTGRPVESKVTHREGHRYSLRARPYNSAADEIDGILVVLIDIEVLTQTLEEVQVSRDSAVRAEQMGDSILNSLLSHVAVLSPDGAITAINDAWNEFARENGTIDVTRVGTAANYLEVCRRAAGEGIADAQLALDGIEQVIGGQRRSFHMEYPCHSPTKQRWFLMNVAPLNGMVRGASVTHTDITDRKLAELTAKMSEATVRALLDSSTQSILAVDQQEKIVLVNDYTEKMFGYKREEMVGQTLAFLIPAQYRERHAEAHKRYFDDMQSRPMGIGMVLEALRRDGTTFPVEVALGAIQREGKKLAVAFVADITERHKLEQTARKHAGEVQTLAASLLTSQEEERRRVSRELHDQICQQLAALAMDIGGFAAETPAGRTQERLKELQARVVKVSQETRHIAYELHPSVLDDLGLISSLRELCRQFSEGNRDTQLRFDDVRLSVPVPREAASCLYRVAQESLRNIAVHANAKQVAVAVRVRGGVLRLTVADDGVGFDPQAAKGQGGLGLIGMEERVRLVNGKLSIESRPGQGTMVRLEIALMISNLSNKSYVVGR